MRRWKVSKSWNSEEFESIELMTDIWFYINKQLELNKRSIKSPEALKFYERQTRDRIIKMFEEGDSSHD